jgi:hypothetical protein
VISLEELMKIEAQAVELSEEELEGVAGANDPVDYRTMLEAFAQSGGQNIGSSEQRTGTFLQKGGCLYS